jgi:membrane protease YdiL (CAAX protease family)
VIGVPIMARRSAAAAAHLPRAAIYVNGSLTLWVLAAAAYLVLRLDGDGLAVAGVRAGPAPGAAGMLLWTAALTAFGAGVFALSLAGQRAGIWPAETLALTRMRPAGTAETLLMVLVLAPTAGICEEFLFRGFLYARLTALLGHPALAALIASAAFGLSHIYQGPAGAARAALIGLALAGPALAAGTILPSMAAHALIDIVCTVWIWPLFDRAGSAR